MSVVKSLKENVNIWLGREAADQTTTDNYGARIKHLEQFRITLQHYLDAEKELRRPSAGPRLSRNETAILEVKLAEHRRKLNLLTPRIGRYLRDVNLTPIFVSYPPPVVGGPVLYINLLENLFINHRPRRITPDMLFDFLDKAHGAYRDLLDSGETVESQQMQIAISLITALETKLRPLFREPPSREKEIQDAIEALFTILDTNYSREADSFTYSSKKYVTDFVLNSGRTSLEVKLCARDGREKEIIGEINDDIVAYSTRYDSLLFLVYDVAQIRDVARFKADIERNTKTMVIVIKH